MPLSMKRWISKVAIVTGASAGIGHAIAKSLVLEGLTVVAVARRKDLLEQLAKSLVDTSKGKLHPFQADVSKEDDILEVFEFAKTLGPIHILVNNAGLGHKNSLTDGDTRLWREVFDVNVLGLCIATREAVRDMKINNVAGHIVHINSIVGHKVFYHEFNVYNASKYAITALTETLRLELNALGSNIKITSVSPGVVSTEFFDVSNLENLMQKNVLLSEDISDGVLYVLSTPPHVQVHELTIKPVGEVF